MGPLGELSPKGAIAVGVIVGLISTSLQAIGLTLQRKSHILEDEKDPYELRRPAYKRRRWQLGMFMFVVSNIVGSTIQITTLPLPVLSALQASGLVFNTIFATLILGEPFTRYSFFGTILVCIGAGLIAAFGAVGEPAHTLDQLLKLLYRREFVLWMVATILVVLLVLATSKILKRLSAPNRSRPSYLLELKSSVNLIARTKLLRGVCFGFISGVLSAHALLLAKSAVELVVRTIVDRVNQFNRWQSWMILLGIIALALTQLYYLHRGLKMCSTSVLYPFVFCVYNIIAILDGLIYFQQASQLAGIHAALIAVGTIVLLGGVLCLSWRLEAINAQSGVTVAGTTQAALGPGMQIAEHHTALNDEDYNDNTLGERQPLLAGTRTTLTTRHGFNSQRTPTSPIVSPYRYRAQTFGVQPLLHSESAQIWAELEDSEKDNAAPYDVEDEGGEGPSLATAPHKRSFSTSSLNRSRQTGPLNDMRPFAFLRRPKRRDTDTRSQQDGVSPAPRRSIWANRFRGSDHREFTSRRVSAPASVPPPHLTDTIHGADLSSRGVRTHLSTIFDLDSTTAVPSATNGIDGSFSHQGGGDGSGSGNYTHNRSRSDYREYTTSPLSYLNDSRLIPATPSVPLNPPNHHNHPPATRRKTTASSPLSLLTSKTQRHADTNIDTVSQPQNQTGFSAYLASFRLPSAGVLFARLRRPWSGLESTSSSSFVTDRWSSPHQRPHYQQTEQQTPGTDSVEIDAAAAGAERRTMLDIDLEQGDTHRQQREQTRDCSNNDPDYDHDEEN